MSQRAQEQLALAKTVSERCERELQSFVRTLDPKRTMVDPEEFRLLREKSDWIRRIYQAEHAIAKAQDGTPGIVGNNGQHRWLTSVDHGIPDLLRLCPAAVVGKRLAVTSIDSGTLQLTGEEKLRGWRTAEGQRVFQGLPDGRRVYKETGLVAFSPVLESAHGLPHETHDECCAGFDEWYVFDRDVPDCDIEVFVNRVGFRLHDPGSKLISERFWNHIAGLNPESYISEGTVFTFATRNTDLFSAVLTAFSADLASIG